jgi:hypothetical protein
MKHHWGCTSKGATLRGDT